MFVGNGILFVCMCGLVCVSGDVLGDEGEGIKFYEHVIYINLQLSTNPYQEDKILSNTIKILMYTDSCFMTLISLSVLSIGIIIYYESH